MGCRTQRVQSQRLLAILIPGVGLQIVCKHKTNRPPNTTREYPVGEAFQLWGDVRIHAPERSK